MATEVTMPQMGADMTEGVVLRWLKQVGDAIERGDILAEIETDKATVELESYDAGTLLSHTAEEGETVPVGEIIAFLGTAGEEPPVAKTGHKEAQAGAPAPAATTAEKPAEAAAPAAVQEPLQPLEPATAVAVDADTAGGRVRISPVAKRIALDSGLDVRNLRGSGPDGRILRRDVEGALQAAPAAATPPATSSPSVSVTPAGAQQIVPLTKMREAIARRMHQSKAQQPHYYLTLDVDMTAASVFRKQFNEMVDDAGRASINDLIVKASAIALARHPKFNSEFNDQGILLHGSINIAIGVALDAGLMAPAILDCGNKTLGRIAEDTKDVVARARDGRLTADEYASSTFTITNLGAFGVESLVGIINPPQAAILGIGSVTPTPVARDGEIVIRDVMKLALSADHRVSDGAEGARFVKEIQALLENPAGLAL